jgi:hypothetical protein
MDHGQANIRGYDEFRRSAAVWVRQVCFIVFINKVLQ